MATGERASIRFRYVDEDGVAHDVSATHGETLMSVAVAHAIRGIGGDCGGNCACGTCHVILDRALASTLELHDSAEAELLAFIGHSPSEGHRLGCQVAVTDRLEGTTITVAKA